MELIHMSKDQLVVLGLIVVNIALIAMFLAKVL